MSRRDLSALDRDLHQGLGRQISEAFAHGIDCTIVQGGLEAGQTSLQGVYAEAATQNCSIGTKIRLLDGREFIYCRAGAVGLSKALMHQAPLPVSNYTNQLQTAYGWAIGATTGTILITTGATPAANLFKGGTLTVNKGTGLGQQYTIVSNTSHATIPTVVIDQAVITAWPAASEVTLYQHPFNGSLVVPQTTKTAVPIGVPLIDVTATYYYWSQTAGRAPLTVDAGDTLMVGDTCGVPATSGAAGTIGPAVTIESTYGKVMNIGTASEIALVQLDLGW